MGIITISGLVIFSICAIVFLIVYVKAFKNFLRTFKETHEEKWNEFGSLKSLHLGISNKRARAKIDRWIINETDERFYNLKNVYARVSRLETIAGILIIISVVLFILHLVYTGKL